jgi:hypothetical protein
MTLDVMADADPAPEAGRHPQPRIARKRAGGPDHRFIFKNDRAACIRDTDAPAANPGTRNTVQRGGGHARHRQHPGHAQQWCGDHCLRFSDSRFRPRRDRTGGASPTEIPK